MAKPKHNSTQIEILKVLIGIVKEKRMNPSYQDLLGFGITRDKLRYHFKTLAIALEEARKYNAMPMKIKENIGLESHSGPCINFDSLNFLKLVRCKEIF